MSRSTVFMLIFMLNGAATGAYYILIGALRLTWDIPAIVGNLRPLDVQHHAQTDPQPVPAGDTRCEIPVLS